jgi:hypothetical protein
MQRVDLERVHISQEAKELIKAAVRAKVEEDPKAFKWGWRNAPFSSHFAGTLFTSVPVVHHL